MFQDEDGWRPALRAGGKPAYLAIVDGIAADIRAGRLAPGERLAPQRVLAERLGLNFTTVARGYTEAQRRGLVAARVGQGTFVRRAEAARGGGLEAPVDLSMNLPPEPDDPALLERLRQGIGYVQEHPDLRGLLRYQEFGGSPQDRAAAAGWFAPRLPGLAAERLLVCPGAQTALLGVLTLLVRPGEALCAEAVTYPGVKAQAAQRGLKLHGLPMDAEGPDPDAFAALCRAPAPPRAFYCNPTLQNPTNMTISEPRRHALVAIARRHGVPIIEDDAYGMLPLYGPPPFAALAPELTFHISGLAKCVASGLRIAYAVAPDARQAAQLAGVLHAATVMAAPLLAALATRLIEDGTADLARAAIRREAEHRQRLAAGILPASHMAAHPQSLHLWLRLGAPWGRMAFFEHLRASRVGVVPSDAFTVAGTPPEAVRVCLGGPVGRPELTRALGLLAEALDPGAGVSGRDLTVRAGRIDLNGTNLETGWWGPAPDAAPTLVLLHEGLGSVGLWRGFPTALAEATGCGVFAWSRPGYGASMVVPPPRTLTYMQEEAAARVGPVLDAAGIRSCVLLGHSDGGSIAVLYAGTHADPRVRGLALLAPHVVVEDVSIAGIAAARERYLTGDLRARLARHHADVDATFWGWNGAWLDPGFRAWDITREAAGITVPTLVVQGLGDPYGTKRQVDLLRQALGPRLEPVLLPDIGHAPHLEAPEATLAALLPFLRRVLPPLHLAQAAL